MRMLTTREKVHIIRDAVIDGQDPSDLRRTFGLPLEALAEVAAANREWGSELAEWVARSVPAVPPWKGPTYLASDIPWHARQIPGRNNRVPSIDKTDVIRVQVYRDSWKLAINADLRLSTGSYYTPGGVKHCPWSVSTWQRSVYPTWLPITQGFTDLSVRARLILVMGSVRNILRWEGNPERLHDVVWLPL